MSKTGSKDRISSSIQGLNAALTNAEKQIAGKGRVNTNEGLFLSRALERSGHRVLGMGIDGVRLSNGKVVVRVGIDEGSVEPHRVLGVEEVRTRLSIIREKQKNSKNDNMYRLY